MRQKTTQMKKTGVLWILLAALLWIFLPIWVQAASDMEGLSGKSEESISGQDTEELSGQTEESKSVQDIEGAVGQDTKEPSGQTEESKFVQDIESADGQGVGEPSAQEEGISAGTGLVLENNHYVLYIEGQHVADEGWKELSNGKYYVGKDGYVTSKMDENNGVWILYQYNSKTMDWEIWKDVWAAVSGKEYYFGVNGTCMQIYDTVLGQLMVNSGQRMVPANNQIYALSDGKIYYFDANGIRKTVRGWVEAAAALSYYLNDSGCVASKLEQMGGIWQYFNYNDGAKTWELQKDVWQEINNKDYYFDANGNCIKIYDTRAGKCTKYDNGKMVSVKKEICMLKDGNLYYFNSKGNRVTKKGWHKVSGSEYVQNGNDGYVTAKIDKTKEIWRYYKYDYKAGEWNQQKDVWQTVNKKDYYFNKKGNCIRIYDTKSETCKKYDKGKMVSVKKEICMLKNGKLYYFNAKGVKTTKKGWHKVTGSRYIQNGKKGYVTAKIEKSKKIWRYKKYSYKSKKWKLQKDVWQKVAKKDYYFNKSGKCIRIYNIKTRQCYDCINGKTTLVIKAVRDIRGINYYFGGAGKKIDLAGLYLTFSGQLIYAQSDGRVTKEISGALMDYKMDGERVVSCRVKDANYMSYYNESGELKRQIDLNKAMVALTYDDGPSIYTPSILNTLQQYGGTATFFVVGERVSGYSSTIRRAFDLGCEIGNHTYSHTVLTGVGVPTIQSQITSTNNAVYNVTGVSPKVMRPPGGGNNATVKGAVGMPVILWSIDTLDWKTRNSSSTQTAVLNNIKDGDIVLMHDLYSATAEASQTIIPTLVNRGYQLVTVSELADCRGGMSNGVVYHAFR